MSRGRRQVSSARLFYAVLIGLILAPLQDPSDWTGLLFRLYLAGVLFEALISVSASRFQLRLAGVTGGTCVAVSAFITMTGNPSAMPIALACLIAFAFQVAGVNIKRVMHSRQVNSETIYSAITAYLVSAIGFTATYLLIALLMPEAFVGNLHKHRLFPVASPNDMLFFSIVTMTTTGYGDISPVVPVSRMVASIQMLFGTLYPTVILARLVGIHSANFSTGEPETPDL